MSDNSCCGKPAGPGEGYETVRIRKTQNGCHLCDDYAERQKAKPVVVICCEGACLRGEVARQAANLLCHSLLPEKTARICLGGAFSKNTGQRNLVRHAGRVVAVEGCSVKCGSRMMEGVITGLQPEVVVADQLYDFDRSLFGIEEMPPEQIALHATTVAEKISSML